MFITPNLDSGKSLTIYPKHKYNMIVAADLDWNIGKNQDLLCHIPEDLKTFRKITKNKIVVMGRKTQESLPNKTFLNNRVNIVLSNSITRLNPVDHYQDEKNNAIVAYLNDINQVPNFINQFNKIYLYDNPDGCRFDYMTDGDVFIIGGGQIYKEFLRMNMIDTIYLTEIQQRFEGDTRIPNLYQCGFETIDVVKESDGDIPYVFKILKKYN